MTVTLAKVTHTHQQNMQVKLWKPIKCLALRLRFTVYSLYHIPTLASSNSAANKYMMPKY